MSQNRPQQSARFAVIKIVATIAIAAVLIWAGAVGVNALLDRVSRTRNGATQSSADKAKDTEVVSRPPAKPLPPPPPKGPVAINAVRYPKGELTPHSKDYVYNQPSTESRSYVEFDLRNLATSPAYAELVFTVTQYNMANLPDQTIHVFGYKGDGIISVDDWKTEGTYVGLAGPFTGYKPAKSDRSSGKPGGDFRLDITGLLSEALAGKSKFFGFYFRNPNVTKLDHSDPLAYSALLTVHSVRINFPDKPSGPVIK